MTKSIINSPVLLSVPVIVSSLSLLGLCISTEEVSNEKAPTCGDMICKLPAMTLVWSPASDTMVHGTGDALIFGIVWSGLRTP